MNDLNSRAQAYGQWLVDNQSKQGTPEFAKVAEAYKQLRTDRETVAQADQEVGDRSFTGSLAEGAKGIVRGFGQTAEVLGATDVGKGLQDVAKKDPNQRSATEAFMKPDAPWYDFDWSEFPRAMVEMAPDLAGSLTAARVGGTAGAVGGSVFGPAGTLVGGAGGAVTGAVLYGVMRGWGARAYERAKNNGRDEPTSEDVMEALPGTLAEAGVDAAGLKLLPGAGRLLGRPGVTTGVVRETLSEAGSSAAGQVGDTLGTEAGLSVNPKEVLGEGVLGGGTAAGNRVVETAVAAPGAAKRAIDTSAAGREYDQNPEQIESDLRVADLYERRSASQARFNSGKKVDPDETFKGVMDDLERVTKSTAEALYASDAIDREGRNTLLAAIAEAKKHNREPGQEGESVQYFQTVRDMVDGLGLPPEVSTPILRTLRDLNTVTFSSLKKNKTGPVERFMRGYVGPAAAGVVGTAVGGPVAGVAAGLATRQGAGALGRTIDRVMGTQEPPILARAAARRRALAGREVDYGDTARDMKEVVRLAREEAERVQTEAGRAQADQRALRGQRLADDNPGIQGFDRSIFDQTGLRPMAVGDGLVALLESGRIKEEDVTSFYNSPRDLMRNNRGNHIIDMLDDLAREGVIQRAEGWRDPRDPSSGANPAQSGTNPGGSGVRNPWAYAQTMANVADTTDAAREAAPTEAVRQMINEVANARTQAEKNAILDRAAQENPQYADWIEQFGRPVAGFGPQARRTGMGDNPDAILQELQRRQDAGELPAPTNPGQTPQVTRGEPQKDRGRARNRRHHRSNAGQRQARGAASEAQGTGVPRVEGLRSTQATAEAYKAQAGIDKPSLDGPLPVPEDYLRRVADWMDQQPLSTLDEPDTMAAYEALAAENEAQFKVLVNSGLKFEPYEGDGEPYVNSAEMMKDVRENGHLWYYRTDAGFGSSGATYDGHPMLRETQYKDPQGRPLLVNDVFRIVHDFFGHTQHGFQFGPKGEYNAFHEHARMFSDAAVPALAAETLAQNAWVNFGPHLRREDGSIPKKGDPDFKPQKDRPFSEQRAIVLPMELLRADPNQGALSRPAGQVTLPRRRRPLEAPDSLTGRGTQGPQPQDPSSPLPQDSVPATPRSQGGNWTPLDGAKAYTANRTLRPEQNARSLVDMLYTGNEGVPKVKTLFEAAKVLDARAKTGGKTWEQDDYSPEAVEDLSDIIAMETAYALQKDGNAANWYREKVENTMKIAGLLFPELKTSDTARAAFAYSLAVLSNGVDVPKNSQLAVEQYEHYRETGQMKSMGIGKSANQMKFAFDIWNAEVAKMGLEKWVEFLETEHTVKELTTMGYDVSGELMGTRVPGSIIIGPKIGGGFYPNIRGNWNTLTMDRWFMRTWGRINGSMVGVDPKANAKRREKFRAALSALTPRQRKDLGIAGKPKDDALDEAAKQLFSKYSASGFKDRSPVNKAAQRLAEGLVEVLEMPASGKHRDHIRKSVRRAIDKLREEGVEVTSASLQALVWYPEKELLSTMGVGNKKAAPTDYEAEFRKLAVTKGISDEDVEAALAGS